MIHVTEAMRKFSQSLAPLKLTHTSRPHLAGEAAIVSAPACNTLGPLVPRL